MASATTALAGGSKSVCVCVHRLPSVQQLVDEYAERPGVGGGVVARARHHLRAQVLRRAAARVSVLVLVVVLVVWAAAVARLQA